MSQKDISDALAEFPSYSPSPMIILKLVLQIRCVPREQAEHSWSSNQQLGVFSFEDLQTNHREKEEFRCHVILFCFCRYVATQAGSVEKSKAGGSHGREITSVLDGSFPVFAVELTLS